MISSGPIGSRRKRTDNRGPCSSEDGAHAQALIGYVQLSDAPIEARNPDYMDEATFKLMAPGEGELPLRDMRAALPSGLVISLEIPVRAQAEAGIGPETRLRRCLDAARALMPH